MEKRTRPSRDYIWIKAAQLFAARSTCLKPNGAVLVKDNDLISQGFNGACSGLPHCTDLGACETGSDGGCIRTVHAESNLIAKAAKRGISTEGSEVFCTTSPCYSCAKLLVNAGIKKITYVNEYRDPRGIELLRSCGVEVRQYDPEKE